MMLIFVKKAATNVYIEVNVNLIFVMLCVIIYVEKEGNI